MHIISDEKLKRPGWTYTKTSCGWVGYSEDYQPEINWRHIDGPLLYTSDGNLHWLTYLERIQLFLGWTDISALNVKHRHGRTI